MAIHHYRYSNWDGSQNLPDFTADDLLESMADDLLRGGDPERALRNLMRRGFRLPDGRRFEGMQRLFQQMREYRQDVFSRYDPNGIVDRIREQLDAILRTEREEIERRHGASGEPPHEPPEGGDGGFQGSEAGSPESSPSGMEGGMQASGDQKGTRGEVGPRGRQDPGQSPQAGSQGAASSQSGRERAESGQSMSRQSGSQGSQSGSQSAGGDGASGGDEFTEMLERMLQRKETYLDQLPGDNAGRIKGLREYDFLSPEAREAF
jgi:hypothetical protein